MDGLMHPPARDPKLHGAEAAVQTYRVRDIAVEYQPLVPLVSPNLLVGAKKNLGNFRPALLEPYTLWNIEQLILAPLRSRSTVRELKQPAADWSNTRLVAECLAGDERSVERAAGPLYNLIYSIPLRYGAPPQDAADIFQAVCLDLFNELPRLRDAEALQGWLIRVTTHKCYHWKRRQPKQASELDRIRSTTSATSAGYPADMLDEVEREQMVRDAIAQLPPRCREMIGMFFFE